jgi:hypothetical protein
MIKAFGVPKADEQFGRLDDSNQVNRDQSILEKGSETGLAYGIDTRGKNT